MTESRQLSEFLAQLESIPWFVSIGKPIPESAGVDRILHWDEWPGPEEPWIMELNARQQALYDDILENARKPREQLSALCDRIHAIVLRVAHPRVPYDPKQDAWHAPTAAVWHAAWTAGLIGLCLHLGRRVPAELQEQWN